MRAAAAAQQALRAALHQRGAAARAASSSCGGPDAGTTVLEDDQHPLRATSIPSGVLAAVLKLRAAGVCVCGGGASPGGSAACLRRRQAPALSSWRYKHLHIPDLSLAAQQQQQGLLPGRRRHSSKCQHELLRPDPPGTPQTTTPARPAPGHEAYIVGGTVRDLLLGRTAPKDYDLLTSAAPRDVRALFPRSAVVGQRHPVVQVRGPAPSGGPPGSWLKDLWEGCFAAAAAGGERGALGCAHVGAPGATKHTAPDTRGCRATTRLQAEVGGCRLDISSFGTNADAAALPPDAGRVLEQQQHHHQQQVQHHQGGGAARGPHVSFGPVAVWERVVLVEEVRVRLGSLAVAGGLMAAFAA